MNARAFLALSSLAIATSLTLALGAPGCSLQSEGEPCGEDTDCGDGLKCESSALLGTSTDICCPVDANGAFLSSDNLSCIPSGLTSSSSTSGSTSSTAASSGDEGSAAGVGGGGVGGGSASSGAGGAGGGN